MLDRRELLHWGLMGTAGAAAVGGLPLGSLPVQAKAAPTNPLPANKKWLMGLATSLSDELDYEADVEGTLPFDISGSLFRNGPGLFERGGHRKAHILDGDGMIRALDVRNGKARFRNRFVRTEKYLDEESAGTLKYSTWTTRSPGGMFANLGGGAMKSQAGVTVYSVGETLAALDEVGQVYAMDPATLETTGTLPIDPVEPVGAPKAHTKFDPHTGEWLLMGQRIGRKLQFEFISKSLDGSVNYHKILEAPANYYIHDFAVTKSYFVVVMNPAEFTPFAFLAGMRSFTDSLKWHSDRSNFVLLVPRDATSPAQQFEAPAAFMWHALNAYEDHDQVVLDFVGYEEPDHFIGDAPLFNTIMEGKTGNAKYPGTLRRYRMDVSRGALSEETLSHDHHEFPMAEAQDVTRRHRYGFFAAGRPGDFFNLSQLVRVDMETGKRETFDYGEQTYVGEPVLIADQGKTKWVIQEGLNGNSGHGFYAIFAAEGVSDGPVATVRLEHHLPISFHGHWRAGI